MYLFIEILLVGLSICVLIYMINMKNKYKKDATSSKEDIIKYFEDNNATSVENGIKTKKLPIEIAKNSYLLIMIQDKTLTFKKGKYYLNR